jgi:uncharacterized protein (DUF885 family)
MTGASELQALVGDILGQRWLAHPSEATSLGLHQYDGLLPDVSEQAMAGRLQQLRRSLSTVRAVSADALNVVQGLDLHLLVMGLEEEVFYLERWRPFRTDPMVLQYPIEVTGYMERSYAPLEQRMEAMARLLRQVPGYLEGVRSLVQPPMAKPVLDANIESYQGIAGFYAGDLAAFLRRHPLGSLDREVEEARTVALDAVGVFVEFLKGLQKGAVPEFAIGGQMYSDMLRYGERLDLPLSQVEAAGERDLRRNQERLREAARQMAPDLSVEQAMARLAQGHPSAEQLIAETRDVLEEIRGYVVDHQVTAVVSDVRAMVKETPPFMRLAFAAMDTPGPFESAATESFYYITPVEPDWSPQQAEEWLRNFNHETLRIIGIHEVYPGHYVHSLRERQTHSEVAKVFGAYSFVEGWAHYCEEMMLEAGYGAGEPRLVLAQAKEALVRNCRLLCSIRMHTQGMTLEQATRFFEENAYQEELPAQREALRGTFDPGYLNYTLGKLMIYKLRSDWQSEQGAGYSLGAFHDELLSYGAPPVPLLRSVMLRNDDGRVL